MDLKKRIEELTAEKERIERELDECIKQSTSLGIPVSDEKLTEFYYLNEYGDAVMDFDIGGCCDNKFREILNYFRSKQSAEIHSDMAKVYRRAIANNSKDKAYSIDALLPLLRKGWVAMDSNGTWFWYDTKPRAKRDTKTWRTESECAYYNLGFCFPIEKASDWRTSLRECGVR